MADKKTLVRGVDFELLEDVRLSFSKHLHEAEAPKKRDDGSMSNPTWSCNVLIAKDDPDFEKKKKIVSGIIAKSLMEKYKDPNDFPKYKPDKLPWRDGDLENWDGYAGCMYLSMNTTVRPSVVTRKRKPAKPGDPQFPDSGDYVNCMFSTWIQDSAYGKRVNAEVLGVQYLREGEKFSGRAAIDPNDYFGDIGEDADELEGIGDSAGDFEL